MERNETRQRHPAGLQRGGSGPAGAEARPANAKLVRCAGCLQDDRRFQRRVLIAADMRPMGPSPMVKSRRKKKPTRARSASNGAGEGLFGLWEGTILHIGG